jgi:hypothetical protein
VEKILAAAVDSGQGLPLERLGAVGVRELEWQWVAFYSSENFLPNGAQPGAPRNLPAGNKTFLFPGT